MYRISNKLSQGYKFSDSTIKLWKQALNVETIPSNQSEFFKAQGDGLLFRIKKYIENYSFHMYEQIDKNTGKQISAYDLTWSYAEVLNALNYRGN